MRQTFETRCYDLASYLVAKKDCKPTVELDESGDVRFIFESDTTMMLAVDDFYHGGIFAKKLLDARRGIMRMSYAARHGQEVESR